jgi:hypothetical protein
MPRLCVPRPSSGAPPATLLYILRLALVLYQLDMPALERILCGPALPCHPHILHILVVLYAASSCLNSGTCFAPNSVRLALFALIPAQRSQPASECKTVNFVPRRSHPSSGSRHCHALRFPTPRSHAQLSQGHKSPPQPRAKSHFPYDAPRTRATLPAPFPQPHDPP